MADTVSTNSISTGTKTVVRQFTNISDGTGETDVVKLDISGLTGPDGTSAPSKIKILEVEWAIQGFNYIKLSYDRDTDVTACVLPAGAGYKNFSRVGGIPDTGSGGTGDLLLTTNGGAANSTYDITVRIQLEV